MASLSGPLVLSSMGLGAKKPDRVGRLSGPGCFAKYKSPPADMRMTPLGLATQLALAYAIHKSFIFIRVPLTAAVTPKVVKVLRGWGYQIGKRKPKAR